MVSTPNVVYVVFDRFPAPKGAAIHIAAFAAALGAAFGPVELVTLPDNAVSSQGDASAANASASIASEPPVSIPGVTHTSLPAPGRTVIDRAMAFRSHFGAWRKGRKFPIIHFRSIFEGYPLARYKAQVCDHLVFEVNGLPSIELKYHYPAVAEDRDLIAKLIAQEQRCIDAADLLITVSDVTANHLISRGADPARIRVIPNGVDLSIFRYSSPPLVLSPQSSPSIRLLYSGTLASWQGADRAVEALALLRRDVPATLTLIGPASRARKEDLRRLADSLAVSTYVRLLDPIPQEALAALHGQHDIALAPLLRNDRNVVQGCCPLKVLEAMAAGTVVIASDLPVVRALAEHDHEALLVRPGSAKAIKDAVLRLIAEPDLGSRLRAAAKARVEIQFTWEIAAASLVRAYKAVLVKPNPPEQSARGP